MGCFGCFAAPEEQAAPVAQEPAPGAAAAKEKEAPAAAQAPAPAKRAVPEAVEAAAPAEEAPVVSAADDAAPAAAEGQSVEKAAEAAKAAVSDIARELSMRKPDAEEARARADRAEKAALSLSKSKHVPDKLRPVIEALAPAVGAASMAAEYALPYAIAYVKLLVALYTIAVTMLPINVLRIVWGVILMLFGGHYITLIAASEAFGMSGGSETWRALTIIKGDAEKVLEASAEDDKRDDDGDGIADVDQVSGDALVRRKALLVLRTVEPEQLTSAVGHLYTAFLGVLATLKLRFAKTIALGASIGNLIRPLVGAVLIPVLSALLPPEYHRWNATVVHVLCKSVAISFAWAVQTLLSAVQSAMQGGLMVSRSVLALLNERGLVKVRSDDTVADEVAGWLLAAYGVYAQFNLGFGVPFPLNWFLWPMDWAELYLKARVMDDA